MARKNRLYPHLLPEDIAVWERFLHARGHQFTAFDYDVRVGIGRDPGSHYAQNIRAMAIGLSQRRIDVVAYTATAIHIIEVTRQVGLKAVGQIMAYPTLYRQTYQPNLPITPLIVAETLQPDILPVLAANTIFYDLYPPPAPAGGNPKPQLSEDSPDAQPSETI